MPQPTAATVKRLFAISRNICAFPRCTVPIVDLGSGKVTGRICHIKAQRTSGPRYDQSQTDAERHAFENLILLCPIHHDVIDTDTQAYTVDRLVAMKQEHESSQPAGEPSDEVVSQLLLVSNAVSPGSVITSISQTGGQLAHSITNITVAQSPTVDDNMSRLRDGSAEARRVTGEQKASIMRHIAPVLARVREVNGVGVQIVVNAINGWDSQDYARQFVELFRELGFHIGNFRHMQSTNMGDGNDDLRYGRCYSGLIILWDPRWWERDARLPAFGLDLASAMHAAGIPVRVVADHGAYPVELIVCGRKE